MDIVNPEFNVRYNFANQYALLWTPNPYGDLLMRICTPFLFFQWVFTNFQCVITLLRALSVALHVCSKWDGTSRPKEQASPVGKPGPSKMIFGNLS